MNLTIVKYFWKLLLIVFVTQTTIVVCDKPICPDHEVNNQWGKNNNCVHHSWFILIIYCICNRLIFISTLDGKLTALNIADGGREAWELSTEPGALLSSNIDQLEVKINVYKNIVKWFTMCVHV